MQQMKGFATQALDLKQSALRVETHEGKLKQLEQELEQTRKNIREMEKVRDSHNRQEIKRHEYVVNLNSKTRALENFGK